MSSLKEIKGRIASVKSTLKITTAMKMVSSAKLHRAQQWIGNMVPYQSKLSGMLSDLLESGVDISSFTSDNGAKKVAVVAFSSNSSLCGGFNANALKNFHSAVNPLIDGGLDKKDIIVYTFGRKICESLRKEDFFIQTDCSSLVDKPSYDGAAQVAERLIEGFNRREFGKVILVWNHYKSNAAQPPMQEVYLPYGQGLNKNSVYSNQDGVEPDMEDEEFMTQEGMDDWNDGGNSETDIWGGNGKISAGKGTKNDNDSESDFIIEPSPAEVISSLLPKVMLLKIYTVLLDSYAAEHAARTLAMQIASDNADELLSTLNLEYNKSRQMAITNELLDIVGGSFK